MKETTAQERMDLLKEIADAALDTIQEWLKRWQTDAGGNVRLRYYEDGKTVVEVDEDEVMSIRLAVSADVVDYVDAVNKPSGLVLSRTWGTVPAGWFVRTPRGAWLEVLATRLDGDRQVVTLDMSGQRGTFPYDPAGEISVRRGTHSSTAVDKAVDALGDVSILDDSVPFDGPYVVRGGEA